MQAPAKTGKAMVVQLDAQRDRSLARARGSSNYLNLSRRRHNCCRSNLSPIFIIQSFQRRIQTPKPKPVSISHVSRWIPAGILGDNFRLFLMVNLITNAGARSIPQLGSVGSRPLNCKRILMAIKDSQQLQTSLVQLIMLRATTINGGMSTKVV
jgi:hypothetical protein